MLYLLLSLVVLGIVAALFNYFFRSGTDETVNAEPSCATCTGDDERCAHDCMLEAAVRDIEYYDDEHLSLTLRNIKLPERLRDELILLINGGQ